MVVITSFVVSLLTGGLGIYVGARLVVGSEDAVNAILTGLIGAVVWVVGGALFGWIPLLGPVLVLVVYSWLVNRRYPGEWSEAIQIALIAWVVTVIVLGALAVLGVTALEVVGFPEL